MKTFSNMRKLFISVLALGLMALASTAAFAQFNDDDAFGSTGLGSTGSEFGSDPFASEFSLLGALGGNEAGGDGFGAGPIGDIIGSMYHKDAHPWEGGLYGPGGQLEDSWALFELAVGMDGMEFLRGLVGFDPGLVVYEGDEESAECMAEVIKQRWERVRNSFVLQGEVSFGGQVGVGATISRVASGTVLLDAGTHRWQFGTENTGRVTTQGVRGLLSIGTGGPFELSVGGETGREVAQEQDGGIANVTGVPFNTTFTQDNFFGVSGEIAAIYGIAIELGLDLDTLFAPIEGCE